MPDAPVFFVQFPHPGSEHKPGTDEGMPWNTGAHGRKFLESPGHYVGRGGVAGDAELVFWGEWEPPSRVIDTWTRDGRMPQALHRPYWCKPTTQMIGRSISNDNK